MIKFGSKVIVRDRSRLDGIEGVVYKLHDDKMAHVLLDREAIWPVKVENLELVPQPESREG